MPECRLILAFILFMVPIISILLQIISLNPQIFFLIDDILILGLSSLLIYYYYKKKDFNIWFAIFTPIIWFGGGAMKGITLADKYKIEPISLTYLILIFIRTGIIFYYIPKICPENLFEC